MQLKTCLTLSVIALLGTAPGSQAQFYSHGYNTGGTTNMGGSAFGGSLPFGGGTTQYYNPSSGVGTPGFVPTPAYAPPYGYGYGGLGLPYTPYGAGIAYSPLGLTSPLAPGFVRLGPLNLQYWRAPSGYFYPWGLGTMGYTNQTYIINQGQSQPVQQAPPLYSMFSDMQAYLDQSKKDGRVNDADYQHLFRRLQDLRSKYDHLLSQSGTLDPSDEETLRKDAAMLSSEIASRIKPLASGGGKSSGGSPSPSPQSHNKSGWVDE